jgi:hypothetical protein
LTDQSVANICVLKKMQHINMSGCAITDLGLGYLGTMSRLRDIRLFECSKITDRGLTCLGTLRKLQALYIFRCKSITAHGVETLEHLKRLKIYR